MSSFPKILYGWGVCAFVTLTVCGEHVSALPGTGAADTATSGSSITIKITQPVYGFNVLAGSVRRIYATVTGGATNGVNWTTTGGATLSSPKGNWVDVTAPEAGSSCSISGTAGNDTAGDGTGYTITSAKQFTVTAQSAENPSATDTITVNVCKPAVQVSVVPFYTTLFSGQMADVQSFVWGSVDRNVTWAITSQPSGGNGVLADTGNLDTVFSATVAGRYTVTATSVADPAKTNTATVYVTGHNMPYKATPSETMPVDCTVDPALTGTTYDVGPSQTYKTIQSVPWSSLTPGSTVRIHNEDTTGANPTTYHEYFLLSGHGTRTQPIRACGVPDGSGNLPVIDATNATGYSSYPNNLVAIAAVTVGKGGWAGVYTETWAGPQDLIVEGLKVENARPPATLTTPAGVAGKAWGNGAACVRLFQSVDAVVRGIDATGCSNGLFADFNGNNGYAVVTNTLYEGNHVHGNGLTGSYSYHQFYIQGLNEVVQFNVVDQYQSGAEGSNFKDRGFPDVVRYNHFGDGAARELDMVDNQDAEQYTSFEGYLEGATPFHVTYPKDEYTADLMAAAVEAHHADYVYGNTFINTTASVPIHYSTDHGVLENDRLGTLWFYNNSFYEPTGKPYSWALFDTSGGGGNSFQEIEWPQIQAFNNAIWMDSPTKPYFFWNKSIPQFLTLGVNVINSNWGTKDMAGGNGTGWVSTSSPYGISAHVFQGGASNSANTVGISNVIGVPKAPFDLKTFAPGPSLVNAGKSIPASGPKLPVRFQYGPAAIQKLRKQPLTIGAME